MVVGDWRSGIGSFGSSWNSSVELVPGYQGAPPPSGYNTSSTATASTNSGYYATIQDPTNPWMMGHGWESANSSSVNSRRNHTRTKAKSRKRPGVKGVVNIGPQGGRFVNVYKVDPLTGRRRRQKKYV